MGRQTTAKADERRRRRNSAKSKAKASALKSAGKSAAGKKPSGKSAAGKSSAGRTAGGTKSTSTTSAKSAPTVTTPKPKKPSTGPAKSPGRSTRTRREFPGRAVFASLRREFARVSAYPLTTYYIVLVAVLALTGLGLVMVLSASSITSYDGGAGSSFAYFNKQAGFAAIGIVLMIGGSFVPLSLWRRLAWPALGLGVLMQAAVFIPGLGKSTKGNANWIAIGSFQLQPSEFLKIALAVWLGCVLANKFGKMTTFGHAMIPVVPGILFAVGLIAAGNDLGTALVLMAMAFVCLLIGGYPWRYFALLIGSMAAAVTFFVLSSENRLKRIEALLTGHADQSATDITGQAWQSNHGLFSLASGGWLGVGLGASREKWSWLPEAHNDFIFAIIGEELGLLGSLAVVLVFAILAYGMFRIIMRSSSLFIQITTAGLFAWLIGQAGINIGVVTGLLPVIGLPLPFVSYGGSSIIASLLAVGVLLSFARTEAGADSAIKVHKDRMRSSFAVLARRKVRK
ncbi:MAG: putative lipid II flippase FtsW [Brevibacterium sp.]